MSFTSTELIDYVALKTIYDNWEDSRIQEHYKHKESQTNNSQKGLIFTMLKKMKVTQPSRCGVMKTIYKFAKGCKDGRQYPNGSISVGSIQRNIRGTICDKYYNDYDMKKCHLKIFSQVCEKLNYPCETIKEVVNTVDAKIEELMKVMNITKDVAKNTYLLAAINGSKIRASPEWFIKFKDEIQIIHSRMIEDPSNSELVTTIQKTKKKGKEWNLGGSVCNRILCRHENNILMTAVKYLTEKKIQTDNIVLCFDGLMVPRTALGNIDETKFLSDMSDLINKKTGFFMEFIKKPMSTFSLEGLEMKDSITSVKDNKEMIIVNSDLDAVEKCLKKFGTLLINCRGKLYIKTSNTRIWTNDSVLVDNELTSLISSTNLYKHYQSDFKPFSANSSGIRAIKYQIGSFCHKDDNFINTLRERSKGLIFFQDKVYDFKIGCFRDELPDDMTPIRILRNVEDNDITKEKYLIRMLNTIFDISNEDDNKLCEPARTFMEHLARGLAGHLEDKDWLIGLGLRNCGKGLITLLCRSAFPQYITEVDSRNFICNSTGNNIDHARNNMWLIDHIYSRLVFSNEIPVSNEKEEKMLDGIKIKSLASGGDIQTVRGLYQAPYDVIFGGRLIFFLNDLPKITPADANQTLSLFKFPNTYVDSDKYNRLKENGTLHSYTKLRDDNIKTDIVKDEYLNSFIHMVLSHYHKHKVVPCKLVRDYGNDFRCDEGDENILFQELFDYTDKDSKLESKIIFEKVNERLKMSAQKIKSFLTASLCLPYSKNYIVDGKRIVGYKGIKLKTVVEDSDIEY